MCWWWQMIHINSNPQGRPHVVHLLHHQLPLHHPPPPPPPCYEQIIQHILHQCHPCSPYSSPSSHQPFNELALGCWQLTRSDKISDQLWSLTLNAGHIQLDILWRKIPKNIIFSWQTRSDKTSFSDQLWSLMLNVGNIQLDDVKKETKEHKSQLTKKEDQTIFLSQTNYILFSDCQNWPYN